MPTFNITSPDGTQYRVDGPEGSTEAQALEKVKAQAAHPGAAGTALDMVKGFGTGLAQAAEAFPTTGPRLLTAAGRWAEPYLESVGIGDPAVRKEREDFLAANPRHALTEGLPEPQTRLGKYAKSVGEFGPAVAAGAGGWVSKIVAALGGGTGAEAAGELTEGTAAEPYARIIGGLAGAMAPSVGARAITPLPATAAHRANVATLEREGVTDLTAGERAGYRPLRYMEEHLGGSPMAGRTGEEKMTLPREQFTRAALARIGETADRATPEVIERAHTRIGRQFDTLAARNDARVDVQYMQDLGRAQQEYEHLFADPLRSATPQNIMDHAVNKLAERGNTMTGPEYKALRSRIERMRRGAAADPELNMFLADVRDAMDGLMERNIRINNPGDAGAWAEVRAQYRNLLAIDRTVTGAETGGLITPAKLKQAAVGQNRSAYAQGRGDFGQLARAGENVMPGLPQSGTAPRHLTEAGLVKMATTGVAGRALMSDPVQAYLGNQAMTDILAQLPPARAAAVRSIIAEAAHDSQERR